MPHNKVVLSLTLQMSYSRNIFSDSKQIHWASEPGLMRMHSWAVRTRKQGYGWGPHQPQRQLMSSSILRGYGGREENMGLYFNIHMQAYFALLCFTLLCFADTALFYKLKVCGNLTLSKSISTVFPIAFAHFVSLCNTLSSLTIFQTFSLLLYLWQWLEITDLCCSDYNVMKAQMIISLEKMLLHTYTTV